jgi:ABC-type multidrug transport system permease subunit
MRKKVGKYLYIIWAYKLTNVYSLIHSFLQSHFIIEYDLVLLLSISSITFLPYGYPVAAYLFFLIFLSLLSFPLSFLQ